MRARPAGVAAPFGLTEEAGGLDYHAGGGQTFKEVAVNEGDLSNAISKLRTMGMIRRGGEICRGV